MRQLRKDIEYPVLVLGPWGHWWAHNEDELQARLAQSERQMLTAGWVLVALLLAFPVAGFIGSLLV